MPVPSWTHLNISFAPKLVAMPFIFMLFRLLNVVSFHISILSGTFMLSLAVCLSYCCFIAFRSYYPCNLSFASVYLFTSVPETTDYDFVLITVEGTVKDVKINLPVGLLQFLILNDRPLTPLSDHPDDPEPLTPNKLLLLKSNSCLPLDVFTNQDKYSKRWCQAQCLANAFWRQKWYFVYPS